MVLKFKQRGSDDVKKVLIYGDDGSGKSTFAQNYCAKNTLNPVCIDVDDTNYTNVPIVEIDLSNDLKAYKNIKKTIAEIVADGSFDTIIIDGLTSMLELFVSKAKGLKKYSDRAERFNDILRDLLNSHMNLIFIGQIDMKPIHTEEFQSPKPIIKINSLVNEKYLCLHEKNKYSHETIKFRAVDSTKPVKPKVEPKQEKVLEKKVTPKSEPKVEHVKVEVEEPQFMTAAEIGEPKVEDNPVRHSCIQIKEMLEREGKLVTKVSMKVKVLQLIADEILPAENEAALTNYIQKHCPEELP